MSKGRTAFSDFEHAGWQRLAGGYDTFFKQLVLQTIDPLLDAAQVGKAERLLDLCSGPGYVADRARRRGAEPIGLDFSAEMIAIAKQSYPDLQFQEGDAEDLPFADGSFDVVVMNFGMHHLGRPERATGEIARVLRGGGRLAFTVWAAPSESIGHRIILSAVERHGTLDLDRAPSGGVAGCSWPELDDWLGSGAQAAGMRRGRACGSSLRLASFSRLM